jgi:hypothetical protein
MGTRLKLQDVLEALQEGVSVYFQPPTNTQMSYPAIVYNRDYRKAEFADNAPYSVVRRYQVTVIATDPDSVIPDLVGGLPMTTFVRHYTVANLNHDIYSVYF